MGKAALIYPLKRERRRELAGLEKRQFEWRGLAGSAKCPVGRTCDTTEREREWGTERRRGKQGELHEREKGKN